ncbi:hypothetical protein CABS01_11325 [Colletotrichum abscissum]|uniref:Uncharacterized protein n=1 Tax=Colletotrichum abscissum TaxID=1671311 RepID=A0A9Q0AXB6_9PEZI|nr:uncharacterized protein CABS01_11325 [Colletotrichum abscissum]KAI3527380.1 hypothetical protein CABS02_15386 [Colletotrichum abscissum]KAK1494309.1 hypothetical protein CABS01_11325 [Colletotrichum abscissum]
MCRSKPRCLGEVQLPDGHAVLHGHQLTETSLTGDREAEHAVEQGVVASSPKSGDYRPSNGNKSRCRETSTYVGSQPPLGMEVRGRVRSDAECGGSALGPVMSRLNQFSAASRGWPAQLLGEAANQMPSKPFCLRMGELKETGVIGTGFSSAHSAHAQLPDLALRRKTALEKFVSKEARSCPSRPRDDLYLTVEASIVRRLGSALA